MIKINELRFGNWLEMYNPMSGEFTKHQYNVSDNYLDIEAYCYPIRLTIGLLQNLGFVTPEYMQDTVFFKDSIMIDLHNGVFKLRDFPTIIPSVHELQNLYFAIHYKELPINF